MWSTQASTSVSEKKNRNTKSIEKVSLFTNGLFLSLPFCFTRGMAIHLLHFYNIQISVCRKSFPILQIQDYAIKQKTVIWNLNIKAYFSPSHCPNKTSKYKKWLTSLLIRRLDNCKIQICEWRSVWTAEASVFTLTTTTNTQRLLVGRRVFVLCLVP